MTNLILFRANLIEIEAKRIKKTTDLILFGANLIKKTTNLIFFAAKRIKDATTLLQEAPLTALFGKRCPGK